MEFIKYHGIGNDFVLIDRRVEVKGEDYAKLAQKVCDRRFGIGGDGLLVVLPSDKADFRMRIFNPDGSEPEMCGNGLRCFAKYLIDENLVNGQRFMVDTLAGIKTVETAKLPDSTSAFKVDMGEPILEPQKIPVNLVRNPVVNQEIIVDGEKFHITCVSMGNPHCIIFIPEVENFPLSKWGPRIETHQLFPRKINVEFIQVIKENEMRMRVWERGAGETLACGTGACASTVAAILNKKTNRAVTIHLDGGDLLVEWNEKDNHVYMTGAAVEVFRGTVTL